MALLALTVRWSHASTDSVEFPATPRARLAPIDGVDDESAFIEGVQSRVDALVSRAGLLSDKSKAAIFRLAAVNLVLSEQLEPACTRTILGIDSAEPRAEIISRRRAAMDRVDELLDLVDEYLSESPEVAVEAASTKANDDNKNHETAFSRIAKDQALLKAFARAMRAYLLVEIESDKVDARRAASSLSSALEDTQPQVAAAAALWQAMLRTREEDPGPALAALDPALLDPPRAAMPYAFFSRLLKCQTMARAGHPASPIAVLMRVEDAVDEWVVGDAAKAAARRAATLVRFQALRLWHDRLDPSANPDERKWCAERAAALAAEAFPEGQDTVFRLHPAIPQIVKAPDEEARDQADAPRP